MADDNNSGNNDSVDNPTAITTGGGTVITIPLITIPQSNGISSGYYNGNSFTISVPITTNGWTITPSIDPIPDLPVEEIKKEAGCTCKKCNEFNEYAEINQSDNTFLCYKCCHNL